MSYLVDALKKAERERHAREETDLRRASGYESAAGSSGNSQALLWLVALLVAVNVGLLTYFWRPYDVSPSAADISVTRSASAPDPAEPAMTRARDEEEVPDSSASGSASAPAPATAANASTQPAAGVGPSDEAENETQNHESVNQNASADRAMRSGRGSVTFSPTPLDDSLNDSGNAASHAGNASDRGRAPSESTLGGRVPQVTINGQLYSSVPGRSFILVGGRRYHEGERLASGPAVESIHSDGATLRYHGQRYRVPGPG